MSTCTTDNPASPKKPKNNRRMCIKCQAELPARKKPRTRMPLSHALETVRAILIKRLDDRLGELMRIGLRVAGDHIPDEGTAEQLAVAFIQETQLALFPEEFGDGPEYTPDPAGRMDVPVVALGLVPRLPTMAVYARHLLDKGKKSPAAALVMTGRRCSPTRI